MRLIRILLTKGRVRAYANGARAAKVAERAYRMGVQFEFLTAELKSGDPYKKTARPGWMMNVGCECSLCEEEEETHVQLSALERDVGPHPVHVLEGSMNAANGGDR